MRDFKIFIGIISFFLPFVALANGEQAEGPETVGQQLQEFFPFEHLEHGHWFAVVLSVVLWASLIYTAYALIQKFRKTSHHE